MAAAVVALLLMGCSGSQSALAPAADQAKQISTLFWWMTAGAAVIWMAVAALTVYAIRVQPDPEKTRRRANLLIIVGGVVVPTVVLAALLAYGLSMLPAMVAPAPPGSLRIAVTGEQWWWRVRYDTSKGPVELANEICLPVGETVDFELTTSNVIHSFWIPSIGGKKDMIPGRTTRLALTPAQTGIFRGACAEYCGMSHALMSFYVKVLPKEEFASWLERQSAPAPQPASESARLGEKVFLANGCGACHSVRGTPATGVLGPDLTHLGSRLSLGAGILTNTIENLEEWISRPGKIKAGVHMPAFRMLPERERVALAEYLKGLE